MTTLHITAGDRAQLREGTLNFIQHAKEDELEERDERAVRQFGTYADFVDSLTPLCLELIKAIANEQPESIREAARLVDRDVSDVHSDLKHLEELGILELKEGGPGWCNSASCAVRQNRDAHRRSPPALRAIRRACCSRIGTCGLNR